MTSSPRPLTHGLKSLTLLRQLIEDENGRRVKRDDQRAGNQADRVEKVQHLKGHQTRGDGEDEDAVAESSERLIIKILRPLLLPEENPIEEIDRRPHGTEPPAEEIAEDENEKKHPESRKHPQDDLSLREDRDDPDKRVEPEIKIYRDLYLKRKCRSKDQIDQERE